MTNSSLLFLLDCVRTKKDSELENVFKDYSSKSKEIEWLKVFETVPHYYYKAKSFEGFLKISKEDKETIEQLILSKIVKNGILQYEIKKIAKEFKKSKIDFIFIKGSALSNTIFKDDNELRIMEDIDVLIKKKQILQSEKALGKLGYESKQSKQERKKTLLEYFHSKYYKNDILLVELHWELGEKWRWDFVAHERPDINLLFSSARHLKLGDTNAKMLEPQYELYLSCFHFERDLFVAHRKKFYLPLVYFGRYKHEEKELYFRALKFFYDTKKILKHYKKQINWEELFSFAKLTKKEYEIFTLLFLCTKVKTNLPRPVLKKIRKNFFVNLYIKLSERIRYKSLNGLFILYRIIFYFNLIFGYTSQKKFYLMTRRIVDGIQNLSREVKKFSQ